jgi:diaminohydroxyphosphoribosylaminopyrimidine deaminase/5-amino-6-(5-phosphoribosylamino)uracil reductase
MTKHFMDRALHLARQREARTSPNPWVGAVVVRDGEIVGEGATEPAGGRHAEVVALADAGDKARAADVYVTLEPCSTPGRTGACTAALINAGVKRVSYAMEDPDSRNGGKSTAVLKGAGIEVEFGRAEEEARQILEPYTHQRRTGRPFVTAKFATSLDGKIAAASGDSRWISSPESRELAHQLRQRIDAILVGSESVVVDNPQLTARPGGRLSEHQPLRVVLDSRGRVGADAAVMAGPGRTLLVTSLKSDSSWRRALAEVADVQVVASSSESGVDPAAVLRLLNERGVLHLLLEGGGRVHGSFFDAGLVDKVQAVIAPLIVGGAGPTPVAGEGAQRMADAWRLQRVTVNRCGPDLIVEGYPERRD